jgi:hypothetical protein
MSNFKGADSAGVRSSIFNLHSRVGTPDGLEPVKGKPRVLWLAIPLSTEPRVLSAKENAKPQLASTRGGFKQFATGDDTSVAITLTAMPEQKDEVF